MPFDERRVGIGGLQMLPSRTQRASATHFTFGPHGVAVAQAFLLVVAHLPSWGKSVPFPINNAGSAIADLEIMIMYRGK